MDIILADQRQATITLVANCIKTKYHSVKTIYSPVNLMRDIKEQYSININYLKAWRLREKALQMLRGKPEESYALLLTFLHMITITNPGSIVDLNTKEDHLFLYVFMALDTSIKD